MSRSAEAPAGSDEAPASSAEALPRRYEMRRRADNIDDTRRRIVEATVELHGTVGPASTTVLAIAGRAGVTRATVYRHFPDDASIFQACSAHWLAQQTVPDPGSWSQVPDAEARLRAGLSDIYRFYRDGADMLSRIYRDLAAVPAPHRRGIEQRDAAFRDVLLGGFARSGRELEKLPDRLRAVVGHAVSFWTWRSLCVGHGLRNDAAVDVMTELAMTTWRSSRPTIPQDAR